MVLRKLLVSDSYYMFNYDMVYYLLLIIKSCQFDIENYFIK